MAAPSREPGVTVRPASGRVHVYFDDAEIVTTHKALELVEPGRPPQYYIPLEDIRSDLLLDSETKALHPGKGEANYLHLRSLTATAQDAAWYYPDPDPPVEALRGHVTFEGESVRVERTDL